MQAAKLLNEAATAPRILCSVANHLRKGLVIYFIGEMRQGRRKGSEKPEARAGYDYNDMKKDRLS